MPQDIIMSRTQQKIAKKLKRNTGMDIGSSALIGMLFGLITLVIAMPITIIQGYVDEIPPYFFAYPSTSFVISTAIAYIVGRKKSILYNEENVMPKSIIKDKGKEETHYGTFTLKDGIYVEQDAFDSMSNREILPNTLRYESVLKQRVNWDKKGQFEQEVYDTPLGLWEKTMQAVENDHKMEGAVNANK